MSWQSHSPLWESFFPALFIPSDIPARNSPVYITALVGRSILLSTALHSHHSLFNMEQAQIWSILENAQEAWCAAKKSGGVWIKMKQCRREQEQGLVVSRNQSKQKERGVVFFGGRGWKGKRPGSGVWDSSVYCLKACHSRNRLPRWRWW